MDDSPLPRKSKQQIRSAEEKQLIKSLAFKQPEKEGNKTYSERILAKQESI